MSADHLEGVCRRMDSRNLIVLWGAFRNDMKDGSPTRVSAIERQEFVDRGRAYMEMIETILGEKGIPKHAIEAKLRAITEGRE